MSENEVKQIAVAYLSKIAQMNQEEIKSSLFNEVDWYTLCLTGKEINDKPIIKILQMLSNEYAKQNQRPLYRIVINDKNNITLAAANGSNGTIEVFNDRIQNTPISKRFVLSAMTIKHENTHFDDWTKLKFCKAPKHLQKEHKKLLKTNKKKLAKVAKPNKESPLLNTDEKEMQNLIVARTIDDKMWDYIKKYKITEPNITRIAMEYYAYLSVFELNARLSEFSELPTILNQINEIKDTSTQKLFVSILSNEMVDKHQKWLSDIGFTDLNNTHKNSHINNYFEMCRILINENFKNNPEKWFNDFKETVVTQLTKLSKELEDMKQIIETSMKKIDKEQNEIIMKHSQITHNAIKTLCDNNMLIVTNPQGLQMIKSSLYETNKNFSLTLLKNIKTDVEIETNNLLHMANKLQELNKIINETPPHCISEDDKKEIQSLTKQLATKILNSEKEILLIALGAYGKLKNLSDIHIDRTVQNQKQGRLLEIYNKMKQENIAKEAQRQINAPHYTRAPKINDDFEL